MRKIFLILFVLLLTGFAFAEELCERVYVTRVIDGDTIEVLTKTDQKIKVRLIGIDTHELNSDKLLDQQWAKSERDYTKKYLEKKYVRLTFEMTPYDFYGRLLSYVFMENGELFNRKIIFDGFAYYYNKYSFRREYMDLFREAQESAIKRRAGFWVYYL